MRFDYSRTLSYFVVLLAAILLLVVFHLKGWLKPIESAAAEIPRPFAYTISGAGNGIKSFFSYFSSVRGLSATNASLSQQIRDLQEQNSALQQDKLENDVLKKELGYRSTVNFNLISADIIGRDFSGFSQTLTLNAGSSSGIQVGYAVVAQGIFVGKISYVYPYSSKVMLISDPQSTVDAELADSGTSGVLRGSYGSGVVLSDIPQTIQIQKGANVVTAGLSGPVPRGILIGNVGDLETKRNDLLQTAAVIPAVDLKNIFFVAIIRP